MVSTWFVMVILVGFAWSVTRSLRVMTPLTWRQHVLELVVETIEAQIKEITRGPARPYVAFVGTLFLFIVCANVLSILPEISAGLPVNFAFYYPPTASLNTTVALALCVFAAVPAFTIAQRGVKHWLRGYIEPNVIMLPFNLLGDLSRTVALAIRLFGNMMSGVVIAGVLLAIAPFFFPIIMQVFGLLVGVIQAYIFAILAMVYIASATQVNEDRLTPRRRTWFRWKNKERGG